MQPNIMRCLDANEVLEYLAHALSSDSRKEVERHLDRCDDCRGLLAELARSPIIDELAPPDPAVEDAPRVGRYVLGARLGVGGMGVVHDAYDPELDRYVALKLVHPERVAAG